MALVNLEVHGVTYSQSQKDAYVLILGEINGTRKIPVIIGSSEAQAIALALEGIQTPRPLTHDLIKNLADELQFYVSEVVIYRFADGVFFTNLTIVQNEKKFIIDSRTSDAIALAIRFNCPIITTEEILNQTGTEKYDIPEEQNNPLTEEEIADAEKRFEFIFDTNEELEVKLAKAVEVENYEIAAIIRDELKSRNK
ncbi:MAG: bifunctional nuclease family protein [Bacteroidales bacterium]|nr:bifunctional nuclease family protein [Bacteroidales bacterium]